MTVTPDGTISAVVSYDSDGAAFANNTKPSGVEITKIVDASYLTDANEDTEFTFQIDLLNPNGVPVDGDSIYWYIQNPDGTIAILPYNG